MTHVKGPTWRSFRHVLDCLYIYGDKSATEIAAIEIARRRLDRKTAFLVLDALCRNRDVNKIHGGNKVRYHLPQENYSKAMKRYAWPKKRWREGLPREARRIFEVADAVSHEVSYLYSKEVQSHLSPDARRFLFLYAQQASVYDQLDLARRLPEGMVCLECLNRGDGLQTASFDTESQLYYCERCGVEQKQEPFSTGIVKRNKKTESARGRLTSPLPSTVRGFLILE
jgi:hypothetical protein